MGSQMKPEEQEIKPVYYLPHNGVYRPEQLSTLLRVVFDPACTYQGISLNSFLGKGPNLIGNLLAVLIHFREEVVAIVGDVSKMFLQVLLKEEDTFVHRFLWRDLDSTIEPDVYRLTRVTFGDKPSPDMASFVVLKIAEEYQNLYPDASEILRKDRYMDDMIHSCKETEIAKERISQLDEMLGSGGFAVKEWYLTSARDASAAHERKESEPVLDISLSQDSIKTLGVGWNRNTDSIMFEVKNLQLEVFTKRSVLSKLSILYDPLGLVTPVTIRARSAVQKVWRLEKNGWDDTLPPDYVELWKSIFEDFKELECLRLPRCVKPIDAKGENAV